MSQMSWVYVLALEGVNIIDVLCHFVCIMFLVGSIPAQHAICIKISPDKVR